MLSRGDADRYRYADGEMQRDYVFVRDVVEANIAALTRSSGTVNIGTGRGLGE